MVKPSFNKNSGLGPVPPRHINVRPCTPFCMTSRLEALHIPQALIDGLCTKDNIMRFNAKKKHRIPRYSASNAQGILNMN